MVLVVIRCQKYAGYFHFRPSPCHRFLGTEMLDSWGCLILLPAQRQSRSRIVGRH